MNTYSRKTNIGLRHFRAALAVAETRSFARAADLLGIVPSALTETIRQFEVEGGVQIFDRRVRPVSATAAGATVLVQARRVVADFDAALTDLRRLGGLEAGAVRVGAAPSMARFPLASAIAGFRAAHPAIDITVHDDIAERLGSLVRDRVLDFALAERWHESDDLVYTPLINDPFVLVCPATHRLARMMTVALADIPAEDLICLDASTGIGKMLRAHAELPERLRSSRLRAHGTISLLLMISQGMGLSLLPKLAASVLQSPHIVQVALADLVLERQLCVVQRAHASLTPAAAALLADVRTVSENADAAVT